MNKAVEFFEEQIRNIRCGRITSSIIDTIKVECYGSKVPIKQIAWTVTEKGRVLVSPYYALLLSLIDKALKQEGYNSYIFSKTQVVINLPVLSGEDKLKIIAQIDKLAEEAKISIRNIRKKFRQSLNKDEQKEVDKKLQVLTDEKIEEIINLTNRKKEQL